ncbi:MAG: DUF4010 domain-containing protein [Bacteriovoracaceae bacterium]
MFQKIISLSLTIYGIQIFSYLIEKKIGSKRGVLFSAFFQGMISSTALTLANAQDSLKKNSHFFYHILLLSSLTGIFASLVELLFIIGIHESELLKRLSILGPVFIILMICMIYHRYHLKDFKSSESEEVLFPRPLEAIKLAFLLAGFIFITSILKDQISPNGPLLVSFVGGLFETHGVALAQVTLVDQGIITMNEAYHHIMVSVMAGFISKMSITLFVVRNKYSYTLAFTYILLSIVTLLLWTLF